jgi:iron uptake system component EfeO
MKTILARISGASRAVAAAAALLAPLAPLGTGATIAGCASDAEPAASSSQADADRATLAVKEYIDANIAELSAAVVALQADAPAPDADGWSPQADRAAIDSMKADWYRARTAYEHIEGAIAVLFPDLDVSTDERYDGFLDGSTTDENLFDDEGVTGIHAVERVLWADSAPAHVVTFEKGIKGYKAAAFPANEQEARDFKEKLCGRLVKDVGSMQAQFKPLALDLSSAFHGVRGSVQEQAEKLEKAAAGDGAEESRYAQYTLADMRANVDGGKAIYAAFQPWLRSKGAEGEAMDQKITQGFDDLRAMYDGFPGDSLPPPPAGFSPAAPDESTPYGKLYVKLTLDRDEKQPGSLSASMLQASEALGLPPPRLSANTPRRPWPEGFRAPVHCPAPTRKHPLALQVHAAPDGCAGQRRRRPHRRLLGEQRRRRAHVPGRAQDEAHQRWRVVRGVRA